MFLKQILNKKKALQKAKIHIIKLIYFNVWKVISLNKIFLALFSFVIFVILLFTTFLNKNYNNFEDIYYKDNEKGIYSLELKENEFIFNSGSKLGELSINYINNFDKIIQYKGDLKIIENEINIDKGIYLFNFSELNNNYKITGEGFNITTNGPHTIFIDNSGVRTNVFSLNSILELNLINIEENKIVNTVYLYPHKYIKFIPAQNKNVENVDLLKLTQRFPLDYFGERIIIDGKINENILKKVIGNKTEEENEKIKNMFLFIYLNNKNENALLKNFESKKFGILVGEKLIIKYNKLFLNENKQIVYYKNLIIRTIGEIINSKGSNDSKNDFLIQSLNDLKNLSEIDYSEMKKIIYFYSNLVINGKKDDINSKINFSKISNKLEKKEYIFNENYLLELNDTYFKYDYLDDFSFYNNLNNINKQLFSLELGENEKSYIIFYLNKKLINGFEDLNNNKKIKIEDLFNIFDNYVEISIPYYNKKENIRIRTGIEEYNNLLKKLEEKIKDFSFENERDKQGLLIISKDSNIGLNKIKIFEENINKIYKFYENNKNYLSNSAKDELVKVDFSETRKIYDEYILAIKDYNSYIAKYNNKNKEIIFGETINNKGNNNEISISNILNYLSKFNYLETSYSRIGLRGYNYCNNPIERYDTDELNEPYCYKIENLIVGSNVKLDMILIPGEGNNIFNFIINGDKNINKGSYKLDNEEINYKENLNKSGGGKNSEIYKFENFFLNVFTNTNSKDLDGNNNLNKDNNEKIIKEESLLIKIFKRNKLFGESGDFKNILSFIDIKYDDVIVEEKGENYDIKVNNAIITYYTQGLKINGLMSGKYIFIPDHSFSDIEIKFLDDSGKNYIYNGNKLKLLGLYNVNQLYNDFSQIFGEINNINLIINILINNNFKNFDIEYSKNNKTFKYKINNNIEIYNNGNTINSITNNGMEMLEKPISIYEIEKTLKLIK